MKRLWSRLLIAWSEFVAEDVYNTRVDGEIYEYRKHEYENTN
jgi:hypothetical protein